MTLPPDPLDQDEGQDNLSHTILWDPQDDVQVSSAEELAIHEMVEGRR